LLPLLLPLLFVALALPSFAGDGKGKGEEKKVESKGRQYALVVGVRNYKKDELRPLKYADKDATSFADALKEAGYRRVVVMTYESAANDADLLPTARNIKEQLKSLLEDRRPEDSVVVAFFGHGVQLLGADKGKDYYLCPMDAELSEPETLVSLSEVYRELGKSKAGNKAAIIDAAYPRPGAGAVKLALKARPQDIEVPRDVQVLFSTSADQFSYESEKLKRGLFAHYLLKAMGGAGSPKESAIELKAVAGYLADQVPDAAKDDAGPGARQVPQLVGAGGKLVLASGAVNVPDQPEVKKGPPVKGVVHLAPKVINETLTDKDERDAKRINSYAKVYQFRLEGGRNYQIDIMSMAFDTYLRVEDEMRTELAFDDDGGEGLNSRLRWTPPRNGVYRIIVTTFAAGANGPFTLMVR